MRVCQERITQRYDTMVVTFGSSLRTPPSPAPEEEDEDEGECCQNFETYVRDASTRAKWSDVRWEFIAIVLSRITLTERWIRGIRGNDSGRSTGR